MSQDWKRLAEAIRTARKAHGWNQQALADAAGIGFSTVQRVESGKPYRRRPAALVHIERALDWHPGSCESVLGGGDPSPVGEVGQAVQEAFAQAGLPLPAVVRHALSEGELLDSRVLKFASGKASLVVIAKRDAGTADDGEVGEDLLEWARVERELRGIVNKSEKDQ